MADLSDLELLKKIVDGFHAFATKYEITSEFEEVYKTLRKERLKHSKDRCYSLFDFMEIYSTRPLGELIPFKSSKNEKIKELLEYRIIEDGKISQEMEHFLTGIKSLEDLQQEQWIGILRYLRQVDTRTLVEKSRDYFLLRFETMAKRPFLKRTELLKIINKVRAHGPLKEILDDAYEPWCNNSAVLCNYCGYPMEKDVAGNYKCIGGVLCKEFDRKYLKRERTVDTSEEDYYILKKGFYLFTTLPSLFELYCNELIEKTFHVQVESSPNLESSGDAAIPINGMVYVDYKMHKSVEGLFRKLQLDYKTGKIDFYVLPSFLYKELYKKKLNQLNKHAGNPYRFITEKDLLKELKNRKSEGGENGEKQLFEFMEK